MKTIAMPRFLHEVFGETQTIPSIIAILAIGAAGCAAFAWLGADFLKNAGPLRAVLALLLAFDIAAGCVANFSGGTSNYYARRPSHRLVFIAIHAHLPLLALLAGMPLLPSLAAWVYAAATAFLINARCGKPDQPAIAGILLAIGIILFFILPMGLAQRLISLIFLVKLSYGFAVDHYRSSFPHEPSHAVSESPK
jgi:hypothetical protein